MALTYRNVLKNHLVEVPEPADIIAAAEAEAEKLFRKGTKRDRLDAELITDRARAAAHAMRQTLTKMDQSRRWERAAAPAVTPSREPGPTPAPVTATATATATVTEPPTEAPAKTAKAPAK